LKTLEEWVGYDGWSKAPVARTAWSLIQDFHHDSSILDYQPQAVAVAAIQLAMAAFGAQVPLCHMDGRNSWPAVSYDSKIQLTFAEHSKFGFKSIGNKCWFQLLHQILFRLSTPGLKKRFRMTSEGRCCRFMKKSRRFTHLYFTEIL